MGNEQGSLEAVDVDGLGDGEVDFEAAAGGGGLFVLVEAGGGGPEELEVRGGHGSECEEVEELHLCGVVGVVDRLIDRCSQSCLFLKTI